MNPMRSVRTGLTLAAVAALAVVAAGGCGELSNDSSPRNITVIVGFGDGGGNPLLGDALVQPPGSGETIESIAVGAIVITVRETPYDSADDVDEAASERLVDDAIQSAAFITIEDLPFAGDTISFLIPPDTAGNWQLVAVGSRIDIDVLDDFQGEDELGRSAPIWYGFTPGPDFQNEQIEPGDTITLTIEPGCELAEPPTGGVCPGVP